MSVGEDGFLPLTAPRIARGETSKPIPVNWFERIAPQLPAAMMEPKPPPDSLPQKGPGEVARAIFPQVSDVAAAERELQLLDQAEPPEIAKLKYEAQQAASELIENARLQAQLTENEAREQGYQEGYARGYNDGEQKAIQTLTQRADEERAAYQEDIAAFVAHIEAERKRAWAEIEPQAIQLIFELAKHVIKQEVEASREVSLSVVRNALRRVADTGTLRIRVHASDLETVRGHREELLSLVDNIRHIEIIEDRRVGKGGCVVETGSGNIDARIETQLDEVGATLDRMLSQKESGQ